jgi:hypothetical protein
MSRPLIAMVAFRSHRRRDPAHRVDGIRPCKHFHLTQHTRHFVCEGASMEAMREAWTDDRLDDLNRKVDEGFRRVDADLRGLRGEMAALRTETKADIHELHSEMNGRFDGIDRRIDALRRTTILSNAGVISALIGVIATQL